jgi:hypothetical protein
MENRRGDAVIRTNYRREDLVSAAEYVLDDWVLEGLADEAAPYSVKHIRRGALDKWIIHQRKVIRGRLRSIPVCKMVIGPHGDGLGALSVIGFSMLYPELHPAENDELRVLGPQCREQLIAAILARARELFPDRGPEAAGEPVQRGPTFSTMVRANTFKKIKDAHPEWGYDTVAMHAAEELHDSRITGATVRNAFKAMGWRWERADRIR